MGAGAGVEHSRKFATVNDPRRRLPVSKLLPGHGHPGQPALVRDLVHPGNSSFGISVDDDIGEDISNEGMRHHFGQENQYGADDDDWANMEEAEENFDNGDDQDDQNFGDDDNNMENDNNDMN